jgi:exopolysaccharide biosynthesis polyprenyl glycosylphosphotransferase
MSGGAGASAVISTEPTAVAVGDASGQGYSSRQLKTLVIVLDSVAIAVGMLVAYSISRTLHPLDSERAGPVSLLIGAACLPLWSVIFSHYGLYKARRVKVRLEELRCLVRATLASTIAMAAVSFLTKKSVSRGWLIMVVPAVVGVSLLEREAVRTLFSRLRRSRRLALPVVIVGSNAEAESLCRDLANPAMGYRVVAVVDEIGIGHLGDIPILGTTDDIVTVVQATGANAVIVATTAVSDQASNRLVRELIEIGVHVELTSSLRGISAGRLRVLPLGSTPVIYVEPIKRGGWRALAKRTFDVVGSGVALFLLAPLLAGVAVAVKLDSAGTVFFTQERVGKDAIGFRLFKFRTMVTNAEAFLPALKEQGDTGGVLFKHKNDPRITRIGQVLRRFSIDELPQLINVLRGEMSLVGPRPALFDEMSFWTPELRARLRVNPGLTGMWQVSGRSDLSFEDYIRHDLYYVENWSLLTDLAIVAKTLPVIICKRGAY